MDSKFKELVNIIKQIRKECPWDRKQNTKTIQEYLVEETYEVIGAINDLGYENVCEELGDLLYHIILMTEMFSEIGQFTIDDVIAGITEKMLRRHPHVFGDMKGLSDEEIYELQKQIKLEEKGYTYK